MRCVPGPASLCLGNLQHASATSYVCQGEDLYSCRFSPWSLAMLWVQGKVTSSKGCMQQRASSSRPRISFAHQLRGMFTLGTQHADVHSSTGPPG